MKRLMTVSLGVLLLAAPMFAHEKAAARSKSQWTEGTVTAVSASSITVQRKDGGLTFAIDKATAVSARGASHKMAALEAERKPAMLTEFVTVGADVAVEYQDMGATRLATRVSVRYSPPAASGTGK